MSMTIQTIKSGIMVGWCNMYAFTKKNEISVVTSNSK